MTMTTDKLSLIRPTPDLATAFHQTILEFRENGELNIESIYDRSERDFSVYQQFCLDAETGKNLPREFVPQTTFWMVRNKQYIIGISHLRHYLTPGLKIEGGHIGYSIRPSERNKGYGTQQLALILKVCRLFDLTKVMITCDFDNIGSQKIIEKNGGIRSGEAISPRTNKLVYHYWITL
ncbi:MAG: GNAT family N-acetyltransferase [Anaerolineaceae bacterium]|nr:GNAT family N-acetyltransferase [Anaerolineaceae bacterium]